MSESSVAGQNEPEAAKPFYPRGFRPRRGINWGFLGLLYTSFYMCRYNLSLANKSIADQYHFSYSQMGHILTTALLAYAFGQIINGLLTDWMGGKKAMLIGAAGTVIGNFCFGLASFSGLLWLFCTIRGIDGYMQSFVAPGMTKIKTAWFPKRERGGFAGIFGFMINLGRLGIFTLGPALLAGFTVFGMCRVSPLHWRWLFWGPAMICAIVAVAMALAVKETPEEYGYRPVEEYTPALPTRRSRFVSIAIGLVFFAVLFLIGYLYHIGKIGTIDMGILMAVVIVTIFIFLYILAAIYPAPPIEQALSQAYTEETTRIEIGEALRKIVVNPAVWIVALAYSCTGAVRQVVDQWFPRYMQEVHHTDLQSKQFQFLAFLIPLVASAGSLLSGYISDLYFDGQRTQVAAALYIIQTVVILLAAQFHTANSAVLFFVLISFAVNSTHSILGTAAAMDIGGRKMTGFASGVIDSFQYFGGSAAIAVISYLLDKSWGYYFYFMVPFGIVGAVLMIAGHRTINRSSKL